MPTPSGADPRLKCVWLLVFHGYWLTAGALTAAPCYASCNCAATYLFIAQPSHGPLSTVMLERIEVTCPTNSPSVHHRDGL
jgi:hypothetical protein